MLTLDTIQSDHKEIEDIDFDKDDSGKYYLKQGDDWVCLSYEMKSRLLRMLDRWEGPSGY